MREAADPAKAGPRKADGAAGQASVSRSEYIRQAETRLAETKRKLEAICDRAEKVEKANAQVETHLATIERRLARLKESGEASGKKLRQSIDNAWDDLAEAIRNVVGRLS